MTKKTKKYLKLISYFTITQLFVLMVYKIVINTIFDVSSIPDFLILFVSSLFSTMIVVFYDSKNERLLFVKNEVNITN